ncbi:MAG: DUF397 domain-containing protein [Pseudonocardiaceae bacterium]
MQDLSNVRWKKSSRSGAGNNCVEVADLPAGGRGVRDSKNPGGPALMFTGPQWSAFTVSVRSGEFD